jgi:O-antigen biosynthesis alpha-1,2-rhamnosyltransferase
LGENCGRCATLIRLAFVDMQKSDDKTFPSRIFIDGTFSLCSGKNSGIERVVRSLVRESATAGGVAQVATVFSYENRFFRLDAKQIQGLSRCAAFQRSAVAQMPAAYLWLANFVCWVFPFLSIRKCLLPDSGHLGLFKLAHSFFEKKARKRSASDAREIQFGPGDILLLPDAYWAKMQIWPVVERARKSGAMIASVVYDLIPITHEEFVGDGMKAKFIEYLRCLATHSDVMIAISDTVREQLRSFLPEICEPESYCEDIRSFTLGAEFATVECNPSLELRELFGDKCNSPYLMVATFEPRKNHKYLVDAFEVLWKTYPDLKLCLVGRVGWLCDDLMARLESHPARNRQLFVFHGITDAELQYCYQTSRGVIFPSIVEGFGLPIVESLWHGRKTFVSDTMIHREVGKGDCTYFNLGNPLSLVEEILEWEKEIKLGFSQLPVRQPSSWSESYQQLIECCLDAYKLQFRSQKMQAA